MARPKEIVDETLADARINNHKVSLRLQAIISCMNHPVNKVADVMGVSRHAVWRWAKRFREHGVEGLFDRPKGHNPPKLNEEEREQIAKWLGEGRNEDGEKVHWTIAKLREEVKKRFGKKVGKTPLWLLVRKMGFRQKVPRPSHAKADPKVQEEFKKNSKKIKDISVKRQ
jgi:transposase